MHIRTNTISPQERARKAGKLFDYFSVSIYDTLGELLTHTRVNHENTVRFARGLYVVSALAITTIGWHGVVASIAVVPYLVIVSPYWNITDSDCELANRGWRKFIWLNFFAGALISLVVINYFQAN